MLKRLLRYRELWGDRVAWKIGDLTAEEPHGRLAGQFGINIDFNIDSGTFKTYDRNPWRVTGEYVDHSFSVQIWRWGFWIAVRAGRVRE